MLGKLSWAVLQLRFLSYEDQAVTWARRVAVWFDVALVIALWPVIMDRGDNWRDYLHRLVSRLRRRWRTGLAWAAVWVDVVAPGFATTRGVISRRSRRSRGSSYFWAWHGPWVD